jgi:hypothetical protein
VWREDGRGLGSPGAVATAARRAPVYIDRNGMTWYRRTNSAQMVPLAKQDGADSSPYRYQGFKRNLSWKESRESNLQLASETTVNALIVSGVTPMRFDTTNRVEQTYGGLVNFPRFNESWTESVGSPSVYRNLYISGGFLSALPEPYIHRSFL